MPIFGSYEVDGVIYNDADTKHNVSIITTEYTYKDDVLAHIWFSKDTGTRLGSRINSMLNSAIALKDEYFIEKTGCIPLQREIIPRDIFEEKLLRFDMSQTAIVQEIVEKYIYADQSGRFDEVQIIIKAENSHMTAVIDFKDAEQYKNFICPAWLILP